MDREEKRVRKDMEGENLRWIRTMGSRKSTIEMGKRLKWEIGLGENWNRGIQELVWM
jgi:hypothetical protein